MHFIVNRSDLRQTKFVVADGEGKLAPGEARLRIEKFAFTANNVTYAAVGDLIGYWKFFPAEAGWGRVPVWGTAVVDHSTDRALPEGERIFGYLPMSTHVVVEPARVTPLSFVDGSAHRAALPPVYNLYARLENEPGYDPVHDDRRMLLQPLSRTAFLIDDFLADHDFFGTRTVVLASASSKTAFSLAFYLNRNHRSRCQVIGLTSPGNVAFVEGLGCYDRTVTYGDVSTLPAGLPIVFVDMAGNQAVTTSVHRHYGDGVKHSCQVGLTHWERGGGVEGLPGATPAFFFAPSQIEKRLKDWGPQGLQARFADSWAMFLEGTEGWIRIVHGRGNKAVQGVYLDALEGRAKPDAGHVLSLSDDLP